MLKLCRLEEAKLWFQSLWEGSHAEEMSSRQTKAMPAIFCLLYVGRLPLSPAVETRRLNFGPARLLTARPESGAASVALFPRPPRPMWRPERMTADKLLCSRLERRSWGSRDGVERLRGRAWRQGSSIAPPVGFWLNCFAIVMPSAQQFICADAIYPEVALGLYH